MTDLTKAALILWQESEAHPGTYIPTACPDIKTALSSITRPEWMITPGEVELGIIRRKASPKKKTPQKA